MGQGYSGTSGNTNFLFDYDYYASDSKTATIKWGGAGDGSTSFGADIDPVPLLQYYNVYLEDSSTGTTHGPVRIEKDWPLYASFSGLSGTTSNYTFLVDAVFGPTVGNGWTATTVPLGDDSTADDALETTNIIFTHRLSVAADSLADFAAATGDPYLTTFSGDIYKLPNDNHTYRMIDNFTLTSDTSERFYINTQMYLLPDSKQAWLDHYLQLANKRPEYKQYFDQNPDYIENARAIGGSFMKTSRIALGEEYVEFDMETLELTDYSTNYSKVFSFSDELPIETGLEATHSIDPYTHERGSFRCVRFNTSTHGEVIAKLFTFANPLLRTAINIGSPIRFEASNSNGALLCPQRAENIRVACLDSDGSVSVPETSPFYKLFQETFIKNGDMYQIQMVDCE